MNRYRSEGGSVYEYSEEHNAYLFYCKVSVLTKRELKEMGL